MSGFMDFLDEIQFESVPASGGGVAVAKLATGREYHQLKMQLTNVTPANITNLVLKANSREIFQMSGTQCDIINYYDGLAKAQGGDGILTIPFDRLGLKTRAQEHFTALRTGTPPNVGPDINEHITSLQLEATLASGLSNAAITLAVEQSPAVWAVGGESVRRSVRHRLRYTHPITAAGEHVITALPRGGTALGTISRMFCFHTGNLQRLKVEQNQVTRYNATTALAKRISLDAGKNDVTGSSEYCHPVDFTRLGYGANLLPVRNQDELYIKATTNGSGDLVFITEYLGSLN